MAEVKLLPMARGYGSNNIAENSSSSGIWLTPDTDLYVVS